MRDRREWRIDAKQGNLVWLSENSEGLRDG